MVIENNRKNNTTQSFLCLFIAGLILLPIFIDLMGTLAQLIGFDTLITTFIYYGALWVFLLGSIPGIFRSITSKTFFGILLFFLAVSVLYIMFPEGRIFLVPSSLMDVLIFSPTTVTSVFPYLLIGLAVSDIGKLLKYLHFVARLGVVLGAFSYIVSIFGGFELYYDDMNIAYALCVAVCILIADYKKKDVFFLVLGCLSLILAGTRGPLVCILVATILRVLLYKEDLLRKILKISVAALAIILLQTDLIILLVDALSEGFASIGVNDLRIIDYFREGMLTDSSGRDEISNRIVEKIIQEPLVGYGPGGDRISLMTTSYAHNLFLEIWVSYGIIIGTLILAWMGYWILKAVFGKCEASRVVANALFSSIVVKLFLSSSYLYSKELFLLIGICIAGCVAQQKGGRSEAI